MPARIAVLASGRGSNLRALIDALAAQARGAESTGSVVVALSDRADAGALGAARDAGIAAQYLSPAGDAALLGRALAEHGTDLVVLAGYTRLVPPEVVGAYRGRMLNIHPALLPAFGGHGMYGARVHEAVLAAGVRVSGATVHFVDERYDRGPIAAQWPVPVHIDDTAASLAARVLAVEHWLLPCTVAAVAAGRLTLAAAGEVRGSPWPERPGAAFSLDEFSSPGGGMPSHPDR